jgi:AraC-like DNA-binding protein
MFETCLQSSGIVYRQYVLDQRLARCAHDLIDPRTGHQSVTYIAFSGGFYDGAHFSRAFKAVYDMSPRDYRASSARAVLK